MTLLTKLSDFIIPLFIFGIVFFAMIQKVAVYEAFLEGAKDGLETVFSLMPTMVGLLVSVGILRAGGFLDFVKTLCVQFFGTSSLLCHIIPLLFIKLFSSSAATGLVIDIFKTYGPDSAIGILTSLIMSSTETLFYTMSVYFLAAGIKKTRYTLIGGLFASLAGILASFALVKYGFV